MTKLTKIGVVGPGIIWRRVHKPILLRLSDNYEISAFCSKTEQSREEAAKEFPGTKTFSDYNELAVYPGVDALLVATPIELNAAVAIAALKAGKDVFLEKPIAKSLEDADKIIALEKSSGRTCYVLEQIPYSNTWGKLIDVLNSGEIGKPVMYDKVSHIILDAETDPHGYGGTRWRIEAGFPLGSLFDGGIHAIALLAELFGPPESVFAAGQSLRPDYGEYDNVNMMFRYGSGLQGLFSFSGFLGGRRNHFNIHGTEGLIALEGREFTVEPKKGKAWKHEPEERPDTDPHSDMWRKITESRIAGKPPHYTTQMARRDITILLAVEESIKTGRPVSI